MKNCLVVDDDKINLFLVTRLLKQENYNVFKCENGQEAIEFLNKEKIDIVISDWSMPIIDGVELCRLIRKNKNLKETPFIMMSSNSTENDKSEAFEAGVNHYIVKPFVLSELLIRIEETIEMENYKNLFPIAFSEKNFFGEFFNKKIVPFYNQEKIVINYV